MESNHPPAGKLGSGHSWGTKAAFSACMQANKLMLKLPFHQHYSPTAAATTGPSAHQRTGQVHTFLCTQLMAASFLQAYVLTLAGSH
jgi:hypothetical protein